MALVRRQKNQQMASKSFVRAVAPLGVAAVGALISQRGVDFVFEQAASGAVALTKKAASYLMRAQSGQVAQISSNVVTNPAPANMGTIVTGSAKFQGDIRIRHREFVRSFVASDSTWLSYSINPARSSTFPYLATLGRMYDQYIVHACKMIVVSSASTSAGGRYYISWDPDSTEINPNDPGALMAMQHSVSASAWQTVSLDIPGSKDVKYCDAFPDTVKDHGAIMFLSRGSTSTFDIYLEYEITLRNPEISQVPQVITKDTDSFFVDGNFNNSIGPSYARPLPTPAKQSFFLAPGAYLLVFQFKGSSLAEVAPTILYAEAGTTANYSATNGASNATIRMMLVRSTNIMQITNNDTGTLTDASLTITPLARGGYDNLYASF